MQQLTLRGFDEELERRLRQIAKERNLSLNRAALFLMRQGAGIEDPARRPDVIGDSLDHLIGIWSPAPAAELASATASFSKIDDDLWS